MRKSKFVLLDTLEDVINQACLQADKTLDSMSLSAYADALHILADFNRVEIISETGKRIIAKWR